MNDSWPNPNSPAFPIRAKRDPLRSIDLTLPLLLTGLGLCLLLFGAFRLEIWAIGAGSGVLVVGPWLARRTFGGSEWLFELHPEGILIHGLRQPYSAVTKARRSRDMQNFFSRHDTALWLEFADGSYLGIDRTLDNFKMLQSVILDLLPPEVRAAMERENISL
ncbi:MAG: hypothetical protein AB7N24_01315 [Dehalococcoidia bacterium]